MSVAPGVQSANAADKDPSHALTSEGLRSLRCHILALWLG